MRQYYLLMSPGDPERPERPEYNVYRGGSGGRGRGRRAQKPPAGDAAAGSAPAEGGGPDTEEGAGYTVYKARRGFKRPGAPDVGGLRERFRRGGGSGGSLEPGEKPLWRRCLTIA